MSRKSDEPLLQFTADVIVCRFSFKASSRPLWSDTGSAFPPQPCLCVNARLFLVTDRITWNPFSMSQPFRVTWNRSRLVNYTRQFSQAGVWPVSRNIRLQGDNYKRSFAWHWAVIIRRYTWTSEVVWHFGKWGLFSCFCRLRKVSFTW